MSNVAYCCSGARGQKFAISVPSSAIGLQCVACQGVVNKLDCVGEMRLQSIVSNVHGGTGIVVGSAPGSCWKKHTFQGWNRKAHQLLFAFAWKRST